MVYRSNGAYRSDRTCRMQLTLLKSLVAQTVCLVVCYALPVGVFIYVNYKGTWYSYSTVVALHYVMYLYAPLNYAMIFIFAKQFRTEVLKLFEWGKYAARTRVGIHFVSESL